MRDPKLYSEKSRWTAEESSLADEFITFVKQMWRTSGDLTCDEVEARFQESKSTTSPNLIAKVLSRMKVYPHVFEVAAAKDELNSLNLDGTLSISANILLNNNEVRSISLNNFTVRVEDYIDFIETRKISTGKLRTLTSCVS